MDLTISGKGLDALVVSKETEETAARINKIRVQKQGFQLKNYYRKHGSSRKLSVLFRLREFRSGEIDRNGHMLKGSSK